LKFDESESDNIAETALGFAYRFATTLDSLAKAADGERKAYEALIRQAPSDGASSGNSEALQEAVLAFEDNSFSLSDGATEILQHGFEIAQQHEIDNSWSEKITLFLVRSEPEKYAGLLGLQLSELTVPSDETWQTTTSHHAGWTEPDHDTTGWQPAQKIGEGTYFKGYGANRLWLTPTFLSDFAKENRGAATSEATIVPVAMTSDTSDSAVVAPVSRHNNVVYFYKDFKVDGLPVSGQIQLFADDSYNLFVNGEYISQFTKPLSDGAVTHIHDFSDFLRAGENTIALEIRDNDNTGGVLEAVIFVKCLPGWEQREAELEARKQKREESLIIERGILPNKN
jgi:hypothetical protein